LVGFFSAHALLTGLDPEKLLHEAWVERVNLPLLLSGDSRALLSFDQLRERLPGVLAEDGPARADPGGIDYLQRRPIALHIQVTGLRGLSYPIQGLRRDSPVAATTYADWGRFELRPGGGLEQMLEPQGRSPLDFVLASAASPGGFAPELLDRSADAEAYESRGIEGFPDSGRLWYTDGGLLGSQPLGRVIAAGRALHGSGEEGAAVHLLVNPRSEDASTDQWSDPDAAPSWQEGASRALAILSEQSLFDDLRRIEKDNSRIEWAQRLADLLADGLGPGEADQLGRFLDRVESERRRMRADEPARDRDQVDELDPAKLLHRALCEIGGLVGKEPIAIDVISPELLEGESGEDVGSLLAGEFMGDFGGFPAATFGSATSPSATRARWPGFARDSASAGSPTTPASGRSHSWRTAAATGARRCATAARASRTCRSPTGCSSSASPPTAPACSAPGRSTCGRGSRTASGGRSRQAARACGAGAVDRAAKKADGGWLHSSASAPALGRV
jgi:hypothetical protein